LLNCEARKGELYYEISHDTLIDPVLDRFKKIEEAEKEAAAQREREELDKAKQQAGYERGLRRKAEVNEKRAKERTRLAYILSGVAIVLALVTGFLAYESNKRQKALEQANILIEQKRLDAEQALARALEEERQRKETQINAFLAKANQLLTFGAIRAAIENLENALKVDSTREDIRQQLKELNTRQ